MFGFSRILNPIAKNGNPCIKGENMFIGEFQKWDDHKTIDCNPLPSLSLSLNQIL